MEMQCSCVSDNHSHKRVIELIEGWKTYEPMAGSFIIIDCAFPGHVCRGDDKETRVKI